MQRYVLTAVGWDRNGKRKGVLLVERLEFFRGFPEDGHWEIKGGRLVYSFRVVNDGRWVRIYAVEGVTVPCWAGIKLLPSTSPCWNFHLFEGMPVFDFLISTQETFSPRYSQHGKFQYR